MLPLIVQAILIILPTFLTPLVQAGHSDSHHHHHVKHDHAAHHVVGLESRDFTHIGLSTYAVSPSNSFR